MLGLNLTWFRAYDPNLARWISRDPIEEGGGINLYAYEGDNPINLTDPLGLKTWPCKTPLMDPNARPGNTRTGPDIWFNPPDGQEIAVVAWPEGTAKERRDSIVIVNRSGSQRSIAYGRYPSWSLDGEVIAFLDGQHCYTIRPDGTNSQLLFSFNRWPSRRWYTLVGPLLWSPDMKYLIYHREDGEKGDSRRIYLLDLKSKEKKEIFSGYPLELVGWAKANSK